MGVFLRFGRDDTLAEVLEMGSGPFAAVDPRSVFPDHQRARCLEVHPERLLNGNRPATLSALVGRSRYTPDGLQVLGLEHLYRIERDRQTRALEAECIMLARSLTLDVDACASLPFATPAWHAEAMQSTRDRLAELIGERERLVEGGAVSLPEEIVDLAGATVPL